MFNQIFSKKVVVPFFQLLGVIAVFQWLVFPGLTAADTIVNILSVLIGFFTLLGLYYIVSVWFISDEPTNEIVEPKKKSNPKQFDGVKSDEPFVKTRTKPKTEKVLGEFQINNKEKVRKSTTKVK